QHGVRDVLDVIVRRFCQFFNGQNVTIRLGENGVPNPVQPFLRQAAMPVDVTAHLGGTDHTLHEVVDKVLVVDVVDIPGLVNPEHVHDFRGQIVGVGDGLFRGAHGGHGLFVGLLNKSHAVNVRP